jgi:hypothetical protein
MTTTTYGALEIAWTLHDRTDLDEEVERCWVGRENSQIGMAHLRLEDGIVHVFGCPRTDVIAVRLSDCEGFASVEPDGSTWTSWTEEPSERARLLKAAELMFLVHRGYCEQQAAWLAAKPWKRVEGMTPADAVTELRRAKAELDARPEAHLERVA